jgi:hypothetical protein
VDQSSVDDPPVSDRTSTNCVPVSGLARASVSTAVFDDPGAVAGSVRVNGFTARTK